MRSIEQAYLKAARSTNGWLRAPCTNCERSGERDYRLSLGIRSDNGRYHCFGCRIHGTLKGVQLILGGPDLDEDLVDIHPPEDFIPLQGQALSALCLEPARRYLDSRKVLRKMWDTAGLGACLSGPHGGRIVVPIKENAQWVGWVARSWEKKVPRPYLYPRGMKRGSLLYNSTALNLQEDIPVMVVEGVFDAISLWPDAVAVLGKPSRQQLVALAAARRPVAVVLDGDAWQDAWALAVRLRFEGVTAGFVRLPPTVDPDEVPKDWLMEEARRCVSQPL